MSIAERRKREKERLKAAILEAAFHIVNKEGFHALTIRRLADRIEYSPRTIYLYYTDKDDILKAIVEYGFASTVKNLKTHDFYRGYSPEDHLKSAISNHLRMAANNINYYNTVIHVIQQSGFEPGPNQTKVERYLSESLAPYLTAGAGTPEDTLALLFASLRGITVELINRKPPMDEEKLERTIEIVFAFYRKLLDNPPGQQGENHDE